MKLRELEPQFLAREDDTHFRIVDSIEEADGVDFLCLKCFVANGGPVGTHRVICWRPRVPQTTTPRPGRWEFQGTGLDDLTLVAGSSSIRLPEGCEWHGYVRNGEVTDA